MHQVKNEKGFSLIEVVISLATISMISWFILEMFVVSEHVNQRAQDLDRAKGLAVSAIELVKKQEQPQGLVNEEFFQKGGIQVEGDSIEVSVDFSPLVLKLALRPTESAGAELSAYESFTVEADTITSQMTAGIGTLYHITASVWDERDPSRPHLVSLETEKYYGLFSEQHAK